MGFSTGASSGNAQQPTLAVVTNSIAHLVPSRLLFLRELKKYFQVQVVVGGPESEQEQKLIKKLLEEGIQVSSFYLDRKSLNLFGFVRSVFSLAGVYRKIKPDVVHQFTIKTIFIGVFAAGMTRVQYVVSTFTGLGTLFTEKSLKYRIARFFFKVFLRLGMTTWRRTRFAVIFQNSSDRTVLESGYLPQKVLKSVIYGNGVDLNFFNLKDEPEEPTKVILPSRLLAQKGIREFAAAVKVLKEEGLDFEAYLLGGVDSGNPSALSEKEIRKWEKEFDLKWGGYQSDIRSWYEKCHIVVLPSYQEGFARVLLEAAAVGRPCVTTDVPGCKEIVVDGKTGFLVPPRDVKRLAEKMKELIQSQELRRLFGKNARVRVEENYSVEKVIGETIRFYRDLNLIQNARSI